MAQELLKIAKLAPLNLSGINLILVLLCEHELFVVSLKEWINSLDLCLLKHLWQVEHHHLLVGLAVYLENFLKDDFNRLVAVELHGQSK